MRTLLTTLNAKYVHSNLALRYLYAVAEADRRQVALREFTINNEDDYIFCELMRGDYDLVCFSCYVWNIEQTLALAENLKKARPQVKILLGGPEVSFGAEVFLQEYSWVDFIIAGEGEKPFAELLSRLESGEEPDFSGVYGLAWREGSIIRVNPPAPLLYMGEVPFPYDVIPCEEDRVTYYESVRGCPFRCAYCLSSIDKSVRSLPMERIRQELSYFLYKRVKQVKFIDRTFNYDAARCEEILGHIIRNDNGVTNFHLEICGDLLSEETLALLERARPGLFQLEIGVQSTSVETLSAIRRSCDFEKLSRSVERLRRLGNVHLHLDLIAGLPHEDYATFRRSFNDVYRLRPHELQLGFLKLLPGSPLAEAAEQYGYVQRKQAPYEIISSSFLSSGDLIRLKMIENVLNLYYNRGGFEVSVERAAFVLSSSPFDFYEELAQFFYARGFQHKSHKKEDLYRILYAFFKGRESDLTGRRKDTISFELLEKDLKATMNFDAVKKFEKKGWELE